MLRHKLDGAAVNRINGFLRDGFACRVFVADLGHGHKPLVCQHGFNHLTRAGATRHHQFVLFNLNQKALRLQVSHNLFARHKAVQAAVFFGRIVIDGRI